MLHNLSEEELILGLDRQDSAVIACIYREIGPRVRNFIVQLGGDHEEAEDIFQEGLIAAFVNIRSGRFELQKGTKFSTYLIQICKFKWFDMLKSAHKSNNDGWSDDLEFQADTDIQEDIITSEKHTILHQFIDELGDKCKSLLNRFYWAKESIEEISKALQMTPASVKNGKYRCMQKLKELTNNNKDLML